MHAIPQVSGARPLIGHILDFRNDRLGLLRRVSQECGDIGAFRFAQREVVVVNHPSDAHTVLTHVREQANRVLRAQRYYLGDTSIFTVRDAHAHQDIRNQLVPLFQQSSLQAIGLPRLIVEQTTAVAATWEDGQIIDLSQAMQHLTLAIITRALLGADHAASDAVGVGFTRLLRYINGSWVLPIPPSWPTPRNLQMRQTLRFMQTMLDALLRQADHQTPTLLVPLLQRVAPEDVRTHIITLLLVGHETTASALAWTWYLLLRHADSYAQLQETDDASVALRCFNEGMRLYPPAYMLTRRLPVGQTLRLPATGHMLHDAQRVVVSPYLLHRRADYFDDPEQFRPARFTQTVPRGAYIPFGAGLRACIGSQLALLEGPLILQTLARHVRFALLPQRVEPEPLGTLRMRHGLRVVVHRR